MTPPARPALRLRVLISFFYFRRHNLARLVRTIQGPAQDVEVQLFFDSGAYSAWSLGEVIDVGAYAAWLHRWGSLATAYANLDVKGDVDAGLRNQAYLEGRGLHPVPVYHGGEPWSVLSDLSAAYPYIALGNVAGSSVSTPEIVRWCHKVFTLAGDRSVFHAFGVTNWTILQRFPWYSVDSSSFGSGFRYGIVPLFDPAQGRFYKLRRSEPAAWTAHIPLLREYGYSPQDILDPARYHYRHLAALGVLSYIRAGDWVRRRLGPVALPGRPDAAPGLHLYLAEAAPKHLLNMGNHLRRAAGHPLAPVDGPPSWAYPGTTRRKETRP